MVKDSADLQIQLKQWWFLRSAPWRHRETRPRICLKLVAVSGAEEAEEEEEAEEPRGEMGACDVMRCAACFLGAKF